MGLSAKQEAFCQEYIKDFNATQAAIRTGYSQKTADRMASRLLSKVEIQEFVSQLQAKRTERVQIDADYVLRRLHEIDQLDVADILTDAGDFLPIKQWHLFNLLNFSCPLVTLSNIFRHFPHLLTTHMYTARKRFIPRTMCVL